MISIHEANIGDRDFRWVMCLEEGEMFHVPEKQRQTTTHQTCSDFLIDNSQRTPVRECTTLDDIFLNKSDNVNVIAVLRLGPNRLQNGRRRFYDRNPSTCLFLGYKRQVDYCYFVFFSIDI